MLFEGAGSCQCQLVVVAYNHALVQQLQHDRLPQGWLLGQEACIKHMKYLYIKQE